MSEPIYLERGPKRVFACSLAWPGWCRVARDAAAATAALGAYAGRYAVVAADAGLTFPPAAEQAYDRFDVVEEIAGSGATDFGVPDAVPGADHAPLEAGEAGRLADLVAASWRALERVAADAPAVLRKGPRGGGRDRDAVVEHVAAAERSYARMLGVRYTPAQFDEPGGPAAMRAELLTALRGARSWSPESGGWPPRYAARRIAWHVLDHAWEIEDRSVGG